tara:strand:- start:2865 stop:3926 length:1062 start_codon:yes stop_codon:yes gene_type:complete
MFNTYPINIKVYILGFVLSFLLSLIITKMLIQVLSRSNFLDGIVKKIPLSAKNDIMPFGGIAVVLSFFIASWALFFIGGIDSGNINLLLIITLSVGFIFLVGIYDDIVGCSSGAKIIIQIAIALILYLSGFQIERIGDWLELNHFAFFLTALWIVGITNSINLIDGEDGLASGIVLLSCLTLFFVYLHRNIFESSLLSIILSGSILGFFIFNLPPAKIILGDNGSLSLGLLVSLITLLPLNQGFTDEIYYLIPVVALLVPIVDTSLSFFRRILNRKNPFSKDKKHLHHRLRQLGLSPQNTILVLFTVSLFFDLVSLIPVYHINLLPNFIPYFFIFAVINIVFMICALRHFEKK